ncbi:hypothetical protein ASF44_30635 [Pseudorhodoferax sp. Leaf274]|nr:hypothetical protein ASF44_30635 [Pseudorhodoferax sp. Leaf274]
MDDELTAEEFRIVLAATTSVFAPSIDDRMVGDIADVIDELRILSLVSAVKPYSLLRKGAPVRRQQLAAQQIH